MESTVSNNLFSPASRGDGQEFAPWVVVPSFRLPVKDVVICPPPRVDVAGGGTCVWCAAAESLRWIYDG
jgi:hypothetical protein